VEQSAAVRSFLMRITGLIISFQLERFFARSNGRAGAERLR